MKFLLIDILKVWLPVTLKHEFQRSVNCLEWKLQAGATLAVGCQYGIAVWTIFSEFTRSGTVPGEDKENFYAWMNYYRFPGHAPITTLAWSPNGKYLIAHNLLFTVKIFSLWFF